ncbi:MAG: hypothetical protein M3N50_02560 [Pseudomonadota bacterium]|nr:hypothetical protein [Pseudomonadota bacterium]
MDPKQPTNRYALRAGRAGALSAAVFALHIGSAAADISLPPITVGAGLQTNFYDCTKSCIYSPGTVPANGNSVEGFGLDTIRLYVNGNVTNQIKFTFNTEYTGSGTNTVEVMDAIGRFEFSDAFNIWAGRFLPPSDRANLYGPYYANDWAPYADGVADFYPNVAVGRDNGIAYWGQFGILKVQVGAFDGASLNSALADKSKVLTAGRLTLDFWDAEPGYYFSGTNYGEKDLLALGLAAQNESSKTTYSLDGMLEKKLGNLGVVNVEAEYMKDNGLTSATASNGWYGLASYLFPQVIGIGKLQILGKYSDKTFDTVPRGSLKTTEFNVNYIIKAFSARVGFYYLHQNSDVATSSGGSAAVLRQTSPHEFGLKLQLQM